MRGGCRGDDSPSIVACGYSSNLEKQHSFFKVSFSCSLQKGDETRPPPLLLLLPPPSSFSPKVKKVQRERESRVGGSRCRRSSLGHQPAGLWVKWRPGAGGAERRGRRARLPACAGATEGEDKRIRHGGRGRSLNMEVSFTLPLTLC